MIRTAGQGNSGTQRLKAGEVKLAPRAIHPTNASNADALLPASRALVGNAHEQRTVIEEGPWTSWTTVSIVEGSQVPRARHDLALKRTLWHRLENLFGCLRVTNLA